MNHNTPKETRDLRVYVGYKVRVAACKNATKPTFRFLAYLQFKFNGPNGVQLTDLIVHPT